MALEPGDDELLLSAGGAGTDVTGNEFTELYEVPEDVVGRPRVPIPSSPPAPSSELNAGGLDGTSRGQGGNGKENLPRSTSEHRLSVLYPDAKSERRPSLHVFHTAMFATPPA